MIRFVKFVCVTRLLTILAATIVCGLSIGKAASGQDGGEAAAATKPATQVPLPADTSPGSVPTSEEALEESPSLPWDYLPYRVLIWVVSDDPRFDAASLDAPLRKYLDLDFSAIWRLDIADAPVSIRSAAARGIGSLSYDSISASDPVLAVKRDHPDAVRLRIALNVGAIVQKVHGTKGRIEEVKRRATEFGNESIDGVAARLEAIDGDEVAVKELWKEKETEALLVSRGMALTLKDPEAKLITPPIAELVGEAVEQYDKIFVVRVDQKKVPSEVHVVEMDTLMRHFGPVAKEVALDTAGLTAAVGRAVTRAFAPVVRIEDAGQRNAVGLLRAGGLILDQESPAYVGKDDVLEPMTRKNDRNGNPILIGPIDWAFLYVTELEKGRLKMDYHAGRPGGLQGRKNKRTFRMALKARPFGEDTLIRLHAKGDVDFPLIGYEIYQRELMSKHMTFIGRTDWNGRLKVDKTDDTLRLFYVKNGGAVLARLPTVPGLTENEVADISGDDMRLQAEAYIRGVQNSIIDLVAIRELFKARILLRLKNGQMDRAKELYEALRSQPTNEKLATDMGKKQDMFIKVIGRNANQRRKVDEMFKTTRELLAKHINPQLINDLEKDMIAAQKNGGKLPEEPAEDEQDGESAGE